MHSLAIELLLRSAVEEDAQMLLDFLQVTCGERKQPNVIGVPRWRICGELFSVGDANKQTQTSC